MNKHANLIYQLKQQARIGMPDGTDPVDYIGSGGKANADLTSTSFENLSIKTKGVAERMDELTNSVVLVADQMKALREVLPSAKILMTEFNNVVSSATGENMGFSRGLGIIIAQQRVYSTQIKAQVKAATYLEESNRGLATGFNLNREAAADFMHVLRGQAQSLGIGDEKLATYAGSLDGLAHGFINASTANDKYVKDMMAGQTIMQNQLGISEQEAQAFESFSAGLNKSSTDNLFKIQDIANQMTSAGGNFEGVDPLQMQKDIIADIADLSADTQMQYSRMPLGLMKATQYAKKLGMSMAQLHTTGKAFLNIEQSIGEELEYQLISGQRLLTDQGTSLTNEYRMATIKGDGLKQAQLMSRFLEDQADTLENNMYAREKAAALFGIDEAQLSKSIQKQKMLNSLGATNLVEMANGDMETVYKQLAKGGATEKQINELKTSMDNRSTEQVANDHLAKIEANTTYGVTGKKMAETGTSAGKIVTAASEESLILAKSYDKLITMFNDPRLATIMGQAANIAGSLKPLAAGMSSMAKDIPGLSTAMTKLKESTDKLAGVSILGLTPTVARNAEIENDDALIMNDGVVQFNKADKFMKVSDSTMIAGTNVDGNKKLARAITTGGGASIDYNQMAAAIISAMKSATFVATVKPDLLFNGKKY